MIRLQVIIKYYLLMFLLIDTISGFIRVYLGITDPIFNIGYWVRGPILALLFLYYIIQLRKKSIFLDELLAIVIFAYFCFNTLFNYVLHPSLRMITENLPYLLRQQFLLFLFVFIKNNSIFSCRLGFSIGIFFVISYT